MTVSGIVNALGLSAMLDPRTGLSATCPFCGTPMEPRPPKPPFDALAFCGLCGHFEMRSGTLVVRAGNREPAREYK